ncbi:MAG TPA: DNA repair protein RecO [Nevskiaceae bacterium]|nr:DNA repair protein RecO [Nevskiaceae bacterium]
MTRQRISLEPGYVLNARAYTDSSLLVEAWTRAHGRVGLVARGARAARSKLRGALQPLLPLLLSWTESGELGTLTGAEADGAPWSLSGERVFYGWYVNELLLKLLQRRDPHPQLYPVYAQTLALLAGEHAEAALRVFELALLTESGYGLPLPDEIDAAAQYRFDVQHGATIVGREAGSVSGASLIALRDQHFDTPQALADARKILRAAIALQLNGRDLETPKLLRELRAYTE